MQDERPVLRPAAVPWSVSSAPHLRLHRTADGKPEQITFVGYFKLNDGMQAPADSKVHVAEDPGDFRADTSAIDSPYRMVRLIFDGGVVDRRCFAVSDHEVIPRSSFDWREVPGALRNGEDALQNMIRTDLYWREIGFSPDPGLYEVEESPWFAELRVNAPGLRHYIMTGHDEYFDIVARGWRWEAGQRA